MRRLIYFVLAFIIWVILTWPFKIALLTWPFVFRLSWPFFRLVWPFIKIEQVNIQVLVAGLIASVIVAVLFHEVLPKEYRVFISPVRMFWLLVYVPVFFYYVIRANLDVVYRALHPKMPIKPGIVKIKTILKTESGITALANSITLTPGTLTVDLTDGGDPASRETFLYIHWINVKSDDIEQASELIAQRFEWFLQKIFE